MWLKEALLYAYFSFVDQIFESRLFRSFQFLLRASDLCYIFFASSKLCCTSTSERTPVGKGGWIWSRKAKTSRKRPKNPFLSALFLFGKKVR